MSIDTDLLTRLQNIVTLFHCNDRSVMTTPGCQKLGCCSRTACGVIITLGCYGDTKVSQKWCECGTPVFSQHQSVTQMVSL